MKELIERLLAKEDSLLLDGKRIEPPKEFTTLSGERSTITCVDGGSAVLLETPSACITYCRIITVTLDTTMKKEILRKEGFIIAEVTGSRITTSFYDKKMEEIYSEKIATLFPDGEPTLAAAANEARKYLEWRAVSATGGAIGSMTNDLVLWDGIFTRRNALDEKEFAQLSGKIIGLAKTTRILGTGSFSRFFSAAPDSAWSTTVSGETFVKLHMKSKHIFRAEILGNANLSTLVGWSCDPIFLGYPYPLILADQLARVSNQEASALLTRLQAAAGEKWGSLSQDATTSAHGLLDRIQF